MFTFEIATCFSKHDSFWFRSNSGSFSWRRFNTQFSIHIKFYQVYLISCITKLMYIVIFPCQSLMSFNLKSIPVLVWIRRLPKELYLLIWAKQANISLSIEVPFWIWFEPNLRRTCIMSRCRFFLEAACSHYASQSFGPW